jgi:hypothetical protein
VKERAKSRGAVHPAGQNGSPKIVPLPDCSRTKMTANRWKRILSKVTDIRDVGVSHLPNNSTES